MGAVKKIGRAVAKPFEKALGGVKDVIAPEIDTSAQEAAAREAAEAQRKAAEQQAQQARWQAEAAAQSQATMAQREQLQQSAVENQPFDEGEADVQVGDTSAESRRRRQQFSASGTSSSSPSIRI